MTITLLYIHLDIFNTLYCYLLYKILIKFLLYYCAIYANSVSSVLLFRLQPSQKNRCKGQRPCNLTIIRWHTLCQLLSFTRATPRQTTPNTFLPKLEIRVRALIHTPADGQFVEKPALPCFSRPADTPLHDAQRNAVQFMGSPNCQHATLTKSRDASSFLARNPNILRTRTYQKNYFSWFLSTVHIRATAFPSHTYGLPVT